ncbi:MAG TPA: LytTR family DNA-binding domain-containing protein [Bacteroidia bacterium]|nr:LytTR family DNA-binding domain-containing protein [Bacteroidia bacterium]
MYTALIIEDSLPDQTLLAKFLNKHFPEIRITGTCSAADEGLKKIKSLRPQLVFLDIEIPPFNGFELLRKLDKIDFEIIFITSHQEYAVRAFKLAAVDFIVKPLLLNDLKVAVKKFESKIISGALVKNMEALMHNSIGSSNGKIKIALPTLNGFEFVNVETIIRCEADGHYTTFYFADRNKILIAKNLKEYEDMLARHKFMRVHDSHLINLNHVAKYQKGDGGIVFMSDQSAVQVSRRHKEGFLSRLNKN